MIIDDHRVGRKVVRHTEAARELHESILDGEDGDVSAGGTALLIDQTSGPVTHLMIGAGKSGTFYRLNATIGGASTLPAIPVRFSPGLRGPGILNPRILE